MSQRFGTKVRDKNESSAKNKSRSRADVPSLLLPDLHGLLIIGFEELKVPVGLDGLPAVLAHVEH